MAWTPKALIALANDLVMSVVVLDDDSETRAAIQGIANQLISEALVADPTLAGQVLDVATLKVDEAIAARNLVEADVTTTADDAVVGLVDSAGARLPGAQWDEFGRPSNRMMDTFANRGMLRADEGTLRSAPFKDALGALTWLSIAPDGGFDHTTYTYLVNRLHLAVSDQEPFVYPGNYVYWVDTNDADLTIYRLDN